MASGSSGSRTSLTLGQAVEVRVDDIDPQGKVSLSLASAPEAEAGGAATTAAAAGASRPATGLTAPTGRWPAPTAAGRAGGPSVVSFEDAFEAELSADLGDLGPGGAAARRGGEGARRPGGDRRRTPAPSAPAAADRRRR